MKLRLPPGPKLSVEFLPSDKTVGGQLFMAVLLAVAKAMYRGSLLHNINSSVATDGQHVT